MLRTRGRPAVPRSSVHGTCQPLGMCGWPVVIFGPSRRNPPPFPAGMGVGNPAKVEKSPTFPAGSGAPTLANHAGQRAPKNRPAGGLCGMAIGPKRLEPGGDKGGAGLRWLIGSVLTVKLPSLLRPWWPQNVWAYLQRHLGILIPQRSLETLFAVPCLQSNWTHVVFPKTGRAKPFKRSANRSILV